MPRNGTTTLSHKILDTPDGFVDDTVRGILLAHPGEYRRASDDGRVLVSRDERPAGTVGIVTGGGSGHLPLFLGYVGRGLATAVAIGNVFSSPSALQIDRATRSADRGGGVLFLYGNYGGDVYNFDLAAQLAAAGGIATRTVRGTDDVMSAPMPDAQRRRGVAGLTFAFKTAGAAAARGDTLDSVARVAARTVSQTRTAGVGLSPAVLPTTGKPTFTLEDGQMEVGVGIHGERGHEKTTLQPADVIASRLFDAIDVELSLAPDDRIAVLVNGLGATPLEELYILYAHVADRIRATGARVVRNFIGEYTTSLEMAGASLSILRLDRELEDLLAAPASSPFYRPGNALPDRAVDDTPSVHAGSTAEGLPLTVSDHVSAVRDALLHLAGEIATHADEFGDLDAMTGDGDLGVTVASGAHAIADVVDALPDNAATSTLLSHAGLAFATANPSTFAALVGSAMLAAPSAAAIDDSAPVTRATAIRIGQAMADEISRRGDAAPGDKTLLDMLLPALTMLDAAGPIAPADFDAFVASRRTEIARMRASRGRAAWQGERSVGQEDPGAAVTGYVLSILLHHAVDPR